MNPLGSQAKEATLTPTGIEMETRAIIKRLAEMPCPDRGEDIGWKDGVHTEFGYRPFQDTPHAACSGTGARFPWLRLPHDGHTIAETGWMPRYNIRLEEVLEHLHQDILDILFVWREIVPLAVGTTEADIRLASWQAVLRAVTTQ